MRMGSINSVDLLNNHILNWTLFIKVLNELVEKWCGYYVRLWLC